MSDSYHIEPVDRSMPTRAIKRKKPDEQNSKQKNPSDLNNSNKNKDKENENNKSSPETDGHIDEFA